MAEWVRHWSGMGDVRMRRGDGELDTEQFSLACDSYLTAGHYYWLGWHGTTRCVPERRLLADAQLSAFRSALPLLPHPATGFALTVGDLQVAGYLFLPAGGAEPRRVVLWPVAAEATAESSYRQVALPILESGLACAVYGPVESTLARSDPDPRERAATAAAVARAVAQWALHQPGVDPTLEPLGI